MYILQLHQYVVRCIICNHVHVNASHAMLYIFHALLHSASTEFNLTCMLCNNTESMHCINGSNAETTANCIVWYYVCEVLEI